MMKLENDQRTDDPLGSLISNIDKRWQMSQLASIPEYSDPFFSIADPTPTTTTQFPAYNRPLPDILAPAPNIHISRTPKHPKRRKYSVESHVRTLASQMVPRSTKETPIQELQRSIKKVWEKRFTPRRVMNELYLPSVLYATRDRLDRNEEEYWMRSDILQRGGSIIKSNDPLEELSGCGIRSVSVYLKRNTMSRADSSVSSSSSKSCLSKARSHDVSSERSNHRLSAESVQRKFSDALQTDDFLSPGKEETVFKKELKRKQNSIKNSKRSQFLIGRSLQTFERRQTRPEDSMYESIDPLVLNKTKLSKAFFEEQD